MESTVTLRNFMTFDKQVTSTEYKNLLEWQKDCQLNLNEINIVVCTVVVFSYSAVFIVWQKVISEYIFWFQFLDHVVLLEIVQQLLFCFCLIVLQSSQTVSIRLDCLKSHGVLYYLPPRIDHRYSGRCSHSLNYYLAFRSVYVIRLW